METKSVLLRIATLVPLSLFATTSGAVAATYDAALTQGQPIESVGDDYGNTYNGNVCPLESSNLTPLATYQDCVTTCKAGIVAIEAMCRFIPDPRARAICWGARFTTPACIGFCGWYYGK